jgi:NAD(P)-dependent dehydrogenase (short-subunit alcohol dehydrogenase family)
MPLDVRSTESWRALYGKASAALGKVDVRANAAGFCAEQPIGATPTGCKTPSSTPPHRLLPDDQAVSARHGERRWSRIVNFASAAANVGSKDNPAYCASKSGILGLTRCVALEGAPYGVTCNAINPGFVNTGMLRSSVRTSLKAEGRGSSRALPPSYTQKRIIEPEEIGALAAFLCREEARGPMEDITLSAGSQWL